MIKTHGLLVDKDGQKMSKSFNNFIDPKDIIEGAEKLTGDRKYGMGADVLRLFVVDHDVDELIYTDFSKSLHKIRF